MKNITSTAYAGDKNQHISELVHVLPSRVLIGRNFQQIPEFWDQKKMTLLPQTANRTPGLIF